MRTLFLILIVISCQRDITHPEYWNRSTKKHEFVPIDTIETATSVDIIFRCTRPDCFQRDTFHLYKNNQHYVRIDSNRKSN